MSNTDKAKNKLMESMRMTKAGSDNKSVQADTQQDLMPKEDKPTKKEKKSAATKKVTKDTQKTSDNPFQTIKRVWPD